MANRAVAHDDLVFSISDLKREGSQRLESSYRDYYNDGAMDMLTLHDNENAYNKFRIRPRTLRNVSDIDLSTSMFGQKACCRASCTEPKLTILQISMPLGFSPAAMQRLAHPDGEVATSRVAANFRIPMCLSSYATASLEEVKAEGAGNPYIMQACIVRDREITRQLIRRARDSGYRAMFISVDVPVLGRRLSEMRANFSLPTNLGFPNILSSGNAEFGEVAAKEAGPLAFDDTLEWKEIIPWLKKEAEGMEIWLKGITTPEDVESAIEYGVDGVVISNHGGRQLDGMPSTVDALAEIAPLAAGKIQLAVDGGIRRGSDIFKALALGAKYCFIGRIPIWGLAYKGQQGVELAVKILRDELICTMALAGCKSIADINRNHLSVLGQNGLLAKL